MQPMPNPKATLDDLIRSFAEQVRRFTMDEVMENLGRSSLGGVPLKGAPLSHRQQNPQLKSGQKRTPESIDALTSELLRFIKSSGGLSIEEIAKYMRSTTAALQIPLHRLLNQKQILKKGQRRSTQYWPR